MFTVENDFLQLPVFDLEALQLKGQCQVCDCHCPQAAHPSSQSLQKSNGRKSPVPAANVVLKEDEPAADGNGEIIMSVFASYFASCFKMWACVTWKCLLKIFPQQVPTGHRASSFLTPFPRPLRRPLLSVLPTLPASSQRTAKAGSGGLALASASPFSLRGPSGSLVPPWAFPATLIQHS